MTGLLLGVLATTALAQTCPTRASWPTDEWPTALVGAEKRAEVKALEEYAFTLVGEDSERQGLRTDGLLIIKAGRVVYERYGRGFDETKRHISWSVAKSISSALVGIAVKEGALGLSDSICTHLTEFAGTPQCAITVKDAITFATGLGWQEEYENSTYQVSSVLAMLFGVGHRDQLRHILTHALLGEPGHRWSYSTGDSELAATLAKRALGVKYGPDAFWKVLFEPIGMKRVVVEEDVRGTPMGGSSVFATPREFAKFGFLFLNDGCWNGQRLLPVGWVITSTTPSDAFVETAPSDEVTPSGYSWWLNRATPSQNKPAPWADTPNDAYAAIGHWGQYIIVVPSSDVVVVRTGDDRRRGVSVNQLTKLALAVAQ
jgi:CubicO group peptidase (beta-lactamase class C family)